MCSFDTTSALDIVIITGAVTAVMSLSIIIIKDVINDAVNFIVNVINIAVVVIGLVIVGLIV